MGTTQGASAGKLVVVIDDDHLILEGMDGLLRSWGFRVISALSERAALAALEQCKERPDLIICDYRSSDGTVGTDTLRTVGAAYRIPVILISGKSVPQRTLEVPIPPAQVMQKPVNPANLRRLMVEILAQSDVRRA